MLTKETAEIAAGVLLGTNIMLDLAAKVGDPSDPDYPKMVEGRQRYGEAAAVFTKLAESSNWATPDQRAAAKRRVLDTNDLVDVYDEAMLRRKPDGSVWVAGWVRIEEPHD